MQSHCGVVVQLVRIPACHAGGRGFESRPLRQIKLQQIVDHVCFSLVPIQSKTLKKAKIVPDHNSTLEHNAVYLAYQIRTGFHQPGIELYQRSACGQSVSRILRSADTAHRDHRHDAVQLLSHPFKG